MAEGVHRSAVQVQRSAVKRMHVAAVENRRLVHFRPCVARGPDLEYNDPLVSHPLSQTLARSPPPRHPNRGIKTAICPPM